MIDQKDLKEIRTQLKMTQKEFADIIGVTKRMYQYYEHQIIKMRYSQLFCITHKLKELGFVENAKSEE